MQFLTSDECKEWCRQRHFDRLPFERDDLARDPRVGFKIPADAGKRVALCHLLWRYTAGSETTQRLLLIEEWSVWPSGEHLPLFARLREALGERRSLIDVPGHVFGAGDDQDGLSFLILATLFLWDFALYSESGSTIVVSHDEFGTIFGPKTYSMSEIREGLTRLQVLD
jgi:hypothetical protein